jgi:hypothetical protein
MFVCTKYCTRVYVYGHGHSTVGTILVAVSTGKLLPTYQQSCEFEIAERQEDQNAFTPPSRSVTISCSYRYRSISVGS